MALGTASKPTCLTSETQEGYDDARDERKTTGREQASAHKAARDCCSIRYGLPISEIDVGTVNQDEVDEAADLARHGSLHVPKVLINVKRFDRFERYVPAWSRLIHLNGRFGGPHPIRKWRDRRRFAARRGETMRGCSERFRTGVSRAAALSVSCSWGLAWS